MAAQKTSKRRPRSPSDEPAPETSGSNLRLRKDPRSERRFEPASSGAAWVSVLGMSIGSVVFGAGFYGQWLRSYARPDITVPHPYAPYLLLGGALVLLAIGLFGPRPARAVRVGDAGVGLEKDESDIERIEWRDVERVLLDPSTLTFQGAGHVIAISRKQQPAAAAWAFAEAKRRIPGKLEEVEGSIEKPPSSASDDQAEVLPLERPQLAGARCKASDELIAFEKDARLCGLCGEVYHKAHVPDLCLTCGARLKA